MHDISLGSETFNSFFEDNLNVCHKQGAFWGKGGESTRIPRPVK
jgi:hypothetical protein